MEIKANDRVWALQDEDKGMRPVECTVETVLTLEGEAWAVLKDASGEPLYKEPHELWETETEARAVYNFLLGEGIIEGELEEELEDIEGCIPIRIPDKYVMQYGM